jgi:hypothetical protein
MDHRHTTHRSAIGVAGAACDIDDTAATILGTEQDNQQGCKDLLSEICGPRLRQRAAAA